MPLAICTRCQAEMASAAQACPKCGNPVRRAALRGHVPVSLVKCPGCQAQVTPTNQACPQCGQPIRQGAPQQDAGARLGAPGWATVACLAVLMVVGAGLSLHYGLRALAPDEPSPKPPLAQNPDENKAKPEPEKIANGDVPQGKSLKAASPPDPEVDAAVEKACAFIKAKVPELANLRAGYAGLNGLALLECDVPADDSAILRIAEVIRQDAPRMTQIYDLAPSLFFLNRWNGSRRLSAADRKLAKSLALRIIAGQVSNGMWSYHGFILGPEQEAKLLMDLAKDRFTPDGDVAPTDKFLRDIREETYLNGRYVPAGRSITGPSMSNTQFAMLAVWGARQHGVPVRRPLLALADYFHANQNEDGSWNYPKNSGKATSTCAGLIGLAIEEAIRKEPGGASDAPQAGKIAKKADRTKAFQFLAKTIGRKKGDPDGGSSFPGMFGGGLFDADAFGDLYFLWTLERVGVIYSMEEIDGRDWYKWGRPIVLDAQEADGSWHEKHPLPFGPLIDTPFALLFLKRANMARDLTEILLQPGMIQDPTKKGHRR